MRKWGGGPSGSRPTCIQRATTTSARHRLRRDDQRAERFDGEGYPQGLAGEAIPMEARIFAIVDGFDAMTSERPYKQPMPLEEALAEIGR